MKIIIKTNEAVPAAFWRRDETSSDQILVFIRLVQTIFMEKVLIVLTGLKLHKLQTISVFMEVLKGGKTGW